jgi:hypothetical protein
MNRIAIIFSAYLSDKDELFLMPNCPGDYQSHDQSNTQ